MSGENYLTLTGAELHSRGKAIYLKGEVAEECSDQTSSRDIYFPLSQCRKNTEGDYECPEWLAKAKAADTVYQWISKRGTKGIDHLLGAALTAEFAGRVFYVDSYALEKARKYAEKQR